MNVLAIELKKYYPSISGYDFYREFFPSGELDAADAFTKGKYTGIALEITKNKKRVVVNDIEREKQVVFRHTVTNDLEIVNDLQNSEHFCVMAPISYAGKTRTSKNARIMYALGIELDNLIVKENGQQLGLENLIDMYDDRAHWLPKPTFVVASGNGVHLYYQFEKPLVLFPNTIKSLKVYKEQLTKMIWNKNVTTSCTDETIQQESIFQGFRMPGTLTKKGDKAIAFRVGNKVTIEYMNSFMYSDLKGSKNIEGVYKTDLRLEDAKERYPDWYEKVIKNNDKSVKEWALSRNVYDWWLHQIQDKAADGHRYHCLMMLAIYAIKCSNYDEKKNPNPVTSEEFEVDVWGLLDEFNSRGKRADNPFTENDILSAIQVYEDRGYITYPVNSVAYKSGIAIEKNKRNGRKQDIHLKIARSTRDILNENWRDGNGRPSAEVKVVEWRNANPDGRKVDCIRETGLSKPTVYKWWNAAVESENGVE